MHRGITQRDHTECQINRMRGIYPRAMSAPTLFCFFPISSRLITSHHLQEVNKSPPGSYLHFTNLGFSNPSYEGEIQFISDRIISIDRDEVKGYPERVFFVLFFLQQMASELQACPKHLRPILQALNHGAHQFWGWALSRR